LQELLDLGEQVDELRAEVAELKAPNKKQEDEIQRLKKVMKSLVALKREKEKVETKEDFPFDKANETEFDNANQKTRAFGDLDATLRRLCGPVKGRLGSPQDSASVEKRAVLIGMLFTKYAATLDLEEARQFLPNVWNTRIKTLEYIVGRVRDAISIKMRRGEGKVGTLPNVDREDLDVILTAVAAEPSDFGDRERRAGLGKFLRSQVAHDQETRCTPGDKRAAVAFMDLTQLGPTEMQEDAGKSW
jgi:hypothetical protein